MWKECGKDAGSRVAARDRDGAKAIRNLSRCNPGMTTEKIKQELGSQIDLLSQASAEAASLA